MRRTLGILFAGPLLAGLQIADAAADPNEPERVQSDISTRAVSIESNFTGIEIVVFGAIDNSRSIKQGQSPYDVIVVIKGPEEALVARRKKRAAGIWVNGPSEAFVSVPSFYAVLSSRQIDSIAAPSTLKTLGIGVDNLRLGGGIAEAEDAFRAALVRLKEERQLFQQHEGSISFIGQSLFRGQVDLPVNVPIGRYTAEVFLFRDQSLLSTSVSRLDVQKAGLERLLYLLAFRYPFLYGLAGVAMAVLSGLIAWAALRRRE